VTTGFVARLNSAFIKRKDKSQGGAAMFSKKPGKEEDDIKENVLFPSGVPTDKLCSTSLMDQYKLTVEIWDRVRARRQLANSFYVTINSAVVVAVWSKDSPAAGSGYVLLVGIALSVLWLLTILNYAHLSNSKSKVVYALEKHLPSAPFSAESKNPRMLPFTLPAQPVDATPA
jgi:hypothetical protein